MLRELRVQNLAVVESCTVRFTEGLNVISGETGAGKSVVLGALGLVLGGRASTDMVRSGARVAEVSALFERDGEQLEVRRTVSARGSGHSTLNGRSSTLGELQELGPSLLCITGQHDQRVLLDPDQHRPLLDDFAALDTGPMRSAWELLLSARAALSRLSFASNNLAERELFLRYQLQELESLAFEAGEEEALGRERELLRHAVELREAARGAESELYSEENSALDRLSRARSLLERVSHLEPAHLERVGRLTAVIAEVEELGRELQVGSQSAPNPRRLDAVEERLAEIARLGRKHGCEAPQLLGVYERLQVELDGLGDVEAQQARAQAAMELAERNAVHEGERLHEQRVKAAKRLDGLLRTELERLAMPHACVRTHVERKELGPHGFCEVELRLSANLGEPPRALHRVASGGELSRVLFALRLQVGCPDATLVFDEIDTGIGGRTAEEVGARVATLARERQLLCISHLPQIASLADAHFVVRKAVRGGRTFSTIRVLNEAGRIEEVARMIGGSTLERATRDYARRLIRAYARVA